jgi:hypothetical protein
MSASARARIGAAQRKRWAEFHAGERKKTGTKLGTKQKKNPALASFWAKMTPEQRSAEMKRRVTVRRKNKAAKAAKVA